VNHVLHFILAEVAAKSAFLGNSRVGWADHFADAGDAVLAAQRDRHHRRRLHKALNLREKRQLGQVRVMLAQDLLRQAHHLHAEHVEAGFLKALQHLAAFAALQTIRFQKNQRLFHKRANHGAESPGEKRKVISRRFSSAWPSGRGFN